MIETVEKRGFTASLTPPAQEAPTSRPTKTALAKVDVQTIATGVVFRPEDHLVAGKITIVDYYADWCGPCLVLDRKLQVLAAERGDIAIRKADIVEWGSKLGEHIIKTYKITGIPYVRVYAADGTFLGAVNKNRIADVERLLPALEK